MKQHLPEWEEVEEPLYEPESGESPAEAELMTLFAEELRETLAEVPEPDESRMRANRSAFLTAGAEMAQEQPPALGRAFWNGILRRFSVQAALLAVLMIISLTGAHVASSNSLPGDRLYDVKLAIEQVEGLFVADAEWEERLQNRRLEEVKALIESGREAPPVDFEGMLEKNEAGEWHVGGVEVPLDADQQDVVRSACPDSAVTVKGQVAEGQFNLSHLTPSCLNIQVTDKLPPPELTKPVIVPPAAEAVPDDKGNPSQEPAKPDQAGKAGDRNGAAADTHGRAGDVDGARGKPATQNEKNKDKDKKNKNGPKDKDEKNKNGPKDKDEKNKNGPKDKDEKNKNGPPDHAENPPAQAENPPKQENPPAQAEDPSKQEEPPAAAPEPPKEEKPPAPAPEPPKEEKPKAPQEDSQPDSKGKPKKGKGSP